MKRSGAIIASAIFPAPMKETFAWDIVFVEKHFEFWRRGLPIVSLNDESMIVWFYIYFLLVSEGELYCISFLLRTRV